MSSMPWIKLYTEMLYDPKIGRLPDSIKWRFVSLLLLAGECDQDGALMTGDTPMTIDDIAWKMRVTREQCVTELESLVSSGLMVLDEDLYYLPKFSARQGRPQSEKRAEWRNRQAKRRESQGKSDVTRDKNNVTPMSRDGHAPRVEESREEKSKSKKKIISADKPRHASPEIPVSVAAYREAAHRYPNKSLYDLIDSHVGSDADRVKFWREVVTAYIALGWNPANIQGQLEWFDRNELPRKNGTNKAAQSGGMLGAIERAQREGYGD